MRTEDTDCKDKEVGEGEREASKEKGSAALLDALVA